jgi:hypothetical protein
MVIDHDPQTGMQQFDARMASSRDCIVHRHIPHVQVRRMCVDGLLINDCQEERRRLQRLRFARQLQTCQPKTGRSVQYAGKLRIREIQAGRKGHETLLWQ